MGTLVTFLVQFYYIAISNPKFVGTWAPTSKIIGDILDFNVLNVPILQSHRSLLSVCNILSTVFLGELIAPWEKSQSLTCQIYLPACLYVSDDPHSATQFLHEAWPGMCSGRLLCGHLLIPQLLHRHRYHRGGAAPHWRRYLQVYLLPGEWGDSSCD